jgi:hypothetical protein
MDPFWARHWNDFQEAGMTEKEVSGMSSDQKRSVLAMLYESTGRELPPSPDNDSFTASPDPIRQSRSPDLQGTQVLNKATFLRLPSYDEARRAEGVFDYAALQALWRSVVEELSVFPAIERIRYSQQIQAAVKELGPESPHGIVIAVLLPSGMRITRTFGFDSPASMVYIWCAGDEKMIKDMAKPGTFVILKRDGIALRPRETVRNQLSEPRVLLNVRLIQ